MIFSVIDHVAKWNTCICLINRSLFKGKDFPIDLETQVFYFHYLYCKVVMDGCILFIFNFTQGMQKNKY
jgi:hypothetical protein